MTDTPKQPEQGIIAKVSGAVREAQLDALKKVGGDESADLAVQSRKAYERGEHQRIFGSQLASGRRVSETCVATSA